MEPSSRAATALTGGETDGACLQLQENREGGVWWDAPCKWSRSGGTTIGSNVVTQSSDGTACPREKVLQEEGDWHLGEAGSHSWCEFCRFVVISITLHRVSHTRAESSSCSCKKAAGAAPTLQIQAGRGVSSSNPSKTLPGHLLFIPSQPLTGSGKDLISWRDGAHSYFVTSNG